MNNRLIVTFLFSPDKIDESDDLVISQEEKNTLHDKYSDM